MRRRVVVTGVGLVSPLGVGTDVTWREVLAGRSGIGPITLFDAARHSTRFAGEVTHFDPAQWMDRKDVKKCGRFIQFAIAATTMAVEGSGLRISADNAERVGVVIGSGIGGFEVIEREHRVLLERGPDRVSPFFILSAIVNLAAGQVSVRFGAKGPNSAVATALHDRRTRGRRRLSSGSARLRRRHDLRRDRSEHHAARHRRLCGDAGACPPATTIPAARAAPGMSIGTGSSSARGRGFWCWKKPATPSAATRRFWRSWSDTA